MYLIELIVHLKAINILDIKMSYYFTYVSITTLLLAKKINNRRL